MNTLYVVNLIVVIFAVIMTARENKIIVKINADKADFENSIKQSIKKASK
jgi:hypothetical protein